jgi:hypothetical protein
MSTLKRTFNPVRKSVSTFVLGTIALLAGASLAFAQTTPPSLGTAASFAVLSAAPNNGGAVTCTNLTADGPLGSSGAPASITQNNCASAGTTAPVDPTVVSDFGSAYNAFAGISCTGSLNAIYSSQVVTLPPGVYCYAGDVSFTSVTMQLDAQGDPNAVWVFKIGDPNTGGALIGSNFSVVTINGGQPENAYWWVAGSVTDTTAAFQGSILAGGAITMTGLAGITTPFDGDVLANGAATLANLTITMRQVLVPSSSPSQSKCNQGVGNGAEGCDPGKSSQNPFLSVSNDESGAVPGSPGRKGGHASKK